MFAPITRAEPQNSDRHPTIQSVGFRSRPAAAPPPSPVASIFRAGALAIKLPRVSLRSAARLGYQLRRDRPRIHRHTRVLVLLAQVGAQHEHARDVIRGTIR